MVKATKFFKRFTAALLAAAMIFMFPSAVLAEEETDDGGAEYAFIMSVGNFIKSYSKYEDITDGDMAISALKKIILENPELYETALKGMMEAVDNYTVYYTVEEAAEFLKSLSGSFAGIGAAISQACGTTIVQSVYEDAPAARAGITAGDVLLEVNGQSVEGCTIDEIVSLIKNEEGTPVELKIRRYGEDEPLTFNMNCETVEENPVDYTVYEQDGVSVGYVSLSSFSLISDACVQEAMDYFDSLGITNIILDLRDNGGGYLDQAVNIADIFLKNGDVIVVEEFRGDTHKKAYVARGNEEAKYNTVVLINEVSASASEVVTAAIKENERGIVVGTTSFGKATVQNMVSLSNGGLLKYTEGVYKTPLGNDINNEGIDPDIRVENDYVDTDVSQYGDFTFSKIYTVGDSGEDVVVAKRYLERLGFFYGDTESDVYDMSLYLAVSLFQNALGLFEYGELDITTQVMIYDYMTRCDDLVDNQLATALAQFATVSPEEASASADETPE